MKKSHFPRLSANDRDAAREFRGGIPARLALACLLGALLVVVGFWLSEWFRLGLRAPAQVLTSSDLELIRGQGERTEGSWKIGNLGTNGVAAVLSRSDGFPSSRYGALSWNIDGLPSAQEVTLFWSTRDNPRAGKARILTLSELEQAYVRLDTEPRWRGEVVGVGLMFRGPIAESVTVRELRLEPRLPSFADALSRLAAPWTFFEPWSGKSINFYRARPADSTISPVTTTALWIGFGFLCYLILFRRQSRIAITSGFAVFALIGWFALDARWQWELGERLIAAQDRYGELATTERTKAAPDARLIQALQPFLISLSSDPARIMILSGDPTNATPARLRYHLSPHRAYAGLSGLPNPRHTRPGDYILVMDSLKSVRYDRSRRILVERNREVPADLVEKAPRIGSLFRVRVGT